MRNFQQFLNENKTTSLNEEYGKILSADEHAAVQLAYIGNLIHAAYLSSSRISYDASDDILKLKSELYNTLGDFNTKIGRIQANKNLSDEIPDSYKYQPDNENEKPIPVKMNKKIF